MKEGEISLDGLSKAAVLAALYNNARVQGMGVFQAKDGDMAEADAQKLLDNGNTYFDYLYGRVMKVDLKGESLWPGLYDRDNGSGAAASVIEQLRASKAA